MSAFSENLKKIRVKKGLTQAELADRMGLSRNSIINYENGRTSPTLELMRKFAVVLDVQAQALDENYILTRDSCAFIDNSHRKELLMGLGIPERLTEAFDKLNREGKSEAVKRVEELAEIPRYTCLDLYEEE